MNVLADMIAKVLPEDAKVLDIGCGDGKIDALIKEKKSSIKIEGIDVFERNKTYIHVTKFNGKQIPFDDNHFDVALLVDVLHHTEDPSVILKEALRVTKQSILIKDHVREGFLSEVMLRFMDYAGNRYNGPRLFYKYLNQSDWECLYKKVGLKVKQRRDRLNLYSFPLNLLFDRKLHFFAVLNCNKKEGL
jgi:ubiquinone/menaquinone biosynthesis C-methylase UbiE